MLEALHQVESELPALLRDEPLGKAFSSTITRRRWSGCGCPGGLSNLPPSHLSVRPGEALFHPHPWPSAMRILCGEYEMAVGYGKGESTPPIAALMIAAGDFRYEMTDADAWHYVRPLKEPTMSLMVTGKPWARPVPTASKVLRPLNPVQCSEIFAFFRKRYQ